MEGEMKTKLEPLGKNLRSRLRSVIATLILVMTASLMFIFSVMAQNLDWARNDGGNQMDSAGPIVVDPSGNSYVSGYFEGSATFGAGEANETTLTSEGDSDRFLVSYDESGYVRWALRVGGIDGEGIGGIVLGQDNRLYVTGYFMDEITLQSMDGNNISLDGNDQYANLFIAIYDLNGNLLWARRDGGWGRVYPYAITVDEAGDIYLTGQFGKTATFGMGDPYPTNITSFGDDDAFVAVYDFEGSLRWVRQAGGTIRASGSGIAVDSEGDIYVSGWFRGEATFGSEGDDPETLTSDGTSYADIFVTKYTANGVFQWARRDGGGSTDYGHDIVLDDAGNSYVTGWYRGLATFGYGEPQETTLDTLYHRSNLYIASYDADGHLIWVIGGSEASCGASDIEMSSAGELYLAGSVETYPYHGPVVFGAGEPNEVALEGFGESDILVARYSTAGSFLDAWLAGGSDNEEGHGIAIHENDYIYVTGWFKYPITFGSGQLNEITLTSNGDYDFFVARYWRLSPMEEIEDVIEEVQALIDSGTLNEGQGNALIAKLEAAVQSLEKENVEAAIGQLQAFINAIEAAIQSGALTPEEGQPLIDAVQDLINYLES